MIYVKKRRHIWKCQKCGLTFKKGSPGEPKRCPMCLDRGAKSYRGRDKYPC
jgi:rubrerythrin